MVAPSQLERLARPFPQRLIHSNPSGGGSYVKHSVVTEKLLAVVGPFDFELVQVIRGDVGAITPNPSAKSDRGRNGAPALVDAIVGAVCRLSVVVDGVRVRIEEVGDCESPHNWPHDGARLKDAMSDALKRCAMRIGVTLHLWSGAEFSLYDQLRTQAGVQDAEGGPGAIQQSGGSNPVASAPSAISPARIQALKSRVLALQADGVPVADEREKVGLPPVDDCDEHQLNLFELMCQALEAELTKPFVKADA